MAINLLADDEKKEPVNLLAEDNQLSKKDKINKLNEITGANRTPFDTIKDIFSGVAKGGENIARLGFGNNVAEAAQSENPNPLLYAAGQYAPLALTGGAGLIPTSLAGASYGAIQNPENPILGSVTGLPISLLTKIPGIGKGISALKGALPKNISYAIQKAHDKLLSQSSDLYNYVKSEVFPRGVGIINVDKDLINQAKKYLPKTDAMKDLIKKAESGDYNALHDLQSDLGKRGTGALGHELSAEQNKGHEMLDIREKINKIIRNQFHEYGHGDLAKLLDEASNKFRTLKETFYKHPTIAKMVHHDTRIIPRKPLTALTEESERTKSLFEKHPEIKKSVDLSGKIGLGLKGAKYGAGTLLLEEFLRDKFLK
jgi:hypothetical protein